ncbi:Crp/Fnr family transcriptional regulator [Aestuariivirga sp.]|uniref:Crp/Fnr family transcriptional regulator n=1 Tax=Aestuariivirga sp. TaxID=2650926 RepID=UPI0039E46F1D
MDRQSSGSGLLDALRSDDFALIQRHLMNETRETADILYVPGDHVGKVYFPLGPSLVSFLVTNTDGADVETILVGREGAVGGIVSAGHLPAYCQITVKFGGPFLTAPIDALEAAKDRSASFDRLFTRYADCLMAQMFQSTACNAIHSVEERAAKWILAAMDRTGDNIVPLRQDELGSMLGVGRSYVSRVLNKFKEDGILTVSRGRLTIADKHALAGASCNCNRSVRIHFDTVLKGVYPNSDR